MKLFRFAMMAVVAATIFSAHMALAETPTTDAKETATTSAPVPTSTTVGLPSHFWTDLVAAFAFGLVVILLVIVGYKLVDWALRRVDFDDALTKGNVAVGIVVAAIVIGIAHAVSSVVVAIIH